MVRFDLFIVMLVLYLGLSAWAYRDVGMKRVRPAQQHEPVKELPRARTEASFWQIALSTVALCLGAVLVTGGVGLMVRGLFGSAQWVVMTLGEGFPVNDVITGFLLVVVGALVVYETRYTIIRHPRPPRRIGHRPV